MADDHRRASRLADGLAGFPLLKVAPAETNMVFVDIDKRIADRFTSFLQDRGIGIAGRYGQRWVTHLDIDDDAVDGALAVVAAFFSDVVA